LTIDITQVEVNGKLPILCLTKLAKRGSPVLSWYRGLIEKSYAGTRSKEGEAAEERLENTHSIRSMADTLHSLPE
jgi:hypothetical protein